MGYAGQPFCFSSDDLEYSCGQFSLHDVFGAWQTSDTSLQARTALVVRRHGVILGLSAFPCVEMYRTPFSKAAWRSCSHRILHLTFLDRPAGSHEFLLWCRCQVRNCSARALGSRPSWALTKKTWNGQVGQAFCLA